MRYGVGLISVCALGVVLLVGCGETALCEGIVCEDDGNECTTAVCDPATGNCQHVTIADDTACDFDGLPGLCKAGVCEDAKLCEGVQCEDDGNPCTDDVCDRATGMCEHVTTEDGTACDFGGMPGLCQTGACVDAKLCEGVDCDDDNECTKDACDPTTGECNHAPVEDGTGCTDGICREGECGPLCIANVCHCSEAGIRAAIEGGGYYPYTFDCDGPTTVVTKAEIEIDNDVILDGEGNLTVDGNGTHRVFSVASYVTTELREMTITRGAASGNGGGIRNDGALVLTGTTVSSSSAGADDGGGIWNQGTLRLVESTVTGNTAFAGGGIENFMGSAELNRCTVSGNTAVGGGGGAIRTGTSGTGALLLINTTVSGNIPAPGRGAIESHTEAFVISSTLQQLPVGNGSYLWDGGGWIIFRNTILHGECAGWLPVDSYGGNIESPADTCGLWAWEDQPSVSESLLNLGPLKDNGGPTLTHLPGQGSVAIDQIDLWACVDSNWEPLETDQRGIGRPQGELCDVGSVEGPSLCEGVDCDDENECTWESCDPLDGSCSYEQVPDWWYCELDGMPGICLSGVCMEDLCAGNPCYDGNECTYDDCDPFTGECDHGWVPDGWFCDFGGGGSGGAGGAGGTGGTEYLPGVCFEGECIENLCAGNPCYDGNECTSDNCDPFTGECINDPVPDGRYCNLGNGGSGGSGGAGGTGGAGGSGYTPGICIEGTCEPLPACVPTVDRCVNGTIDEHSPCCEQPVPDLADACEGTESVTNPASCTVVDNPVTYRLTFMEVEGDCNVGYDIDSCEGQSCYVGGLTPAEGVGGVDNAVAALAPTFEGVGGNLSGMNQALADALCGATDDPEIGTCEGGTNDGAACVSYADCPGGGSCNLDDNDCMVSIPASEIRFVIDANPAENCANVIVLADGTANSHILNLSDDGCASGTLGSIPITIGGIDGTFDNMIIRMTVSSQGFSHGTLGITVDKDTAIGIAEALLEGGGAVVTQVLDIDASTPPTQDPLVACNALSGTLQIAGIAE